MEAHEKESLLGLDVALLDPIKDAGVESEVTFEEFELFEEIALAGLLLAMGFALGFDFLHVGGLYVLLVEAAVLFPAADVVGAEAFTFVGSVEAVNPTALESGRSVKR